MSVSMMMRGDRSVLPYCSNQVDREDAIIRISTHDAIDSEDNVNG